MFGSYCTWIIASFYCSAPFLFSNAFTSYIRIAQRSSSCLGTSVMDTEISLEQRREESKELLTDQMSSSVIQSAPHHHSNNGQSLDDSSSEHNTPSAKKQRSMTTNSPTQRRTGLDLPYESALDALRAYRSIHGDLVIPRRYTVPFDIRYPPSWHGLDLSSSIYNMKWWQKNVKEKPERVEELNKLGFVWHRLQPEWNLVLEALITYSEIYGHVLVPCHFVVPTGDTQWPISTWKIPLGSCVHRIRVRNDFLRGSHAASRRDQLDGLGFAWDLNEHRFQSFVLALRYYAMNHDCGVYSSSNRLTPLIVPSSFIVPSDSDVWPSELWGYPLGARCTAVRQKSLYVKEQPHRKQVLESLGFYWGGNTDVGWLRVVHAAAIYSRMHNRNLDVPYHFVVPSPPSPSEMGNSVLDEDNWPWPEYLWGLPLGQRLKDVRTRGAYLSGSNGVKRRQQLDTLGFVWKPKRGRPRRG
jgi:hypothetical protein